MRPAEITVSQTLLSQALAREAIICAAAFRIIGRAAGGRVVGYERKPDHDPTTTDHGAVVEGEESLPGVEPLAGEQDKP